MNRFFKLKKELKIKRFAEVFYYNLKKGSLLNYFFSHALFLFLINLINHFLIRFGLYNRSDRFDLFSADINIYIIDVYYMPKKTKKFNSNINLVFFKKIFNANL